MKDTLGKEFYESVDKTITIKRQQTAVEWLANELYEKFEMKGDGALFNDLLNQAKEIFEQQIIDARVNAPLLNTEYKSDYVIEAEQYYSQTFGKSTFWYDEDQTTERMNIIGQNGNDGIHYDE
jgi:hypothetical protein